MLRLLIIAALIYLLYRAFNSWLMKHLPTSKESPTNRNAREIDDVMVKDPQCQAYFPKRKAVRLTTDDQELYFCSEECRDTYMLEKK